MSTVTVTNTTQIVSGLQFQDTHPDVFEEEDQFLEGLEKNTRRYAKIFAEAIDEELPTATDESIVDDVYDVLLAGVMLPAPAPAPLTFAFCSWRYHVSLQASLCEGSCPSGLEVSMCHCSVCGAEPAGPWRLAASAARPGLGHPVTTQAVQQSTIMILTTNAPFFAVLLTSTCC